MFKLWDAFIESAMAAGRAEYFREIKKVHFAQMEKIRKELQLLESLKRQEISIDDAIETRRWNLKYCEERLCNILA